MTNREIAHVLFNIATLLELAEGNPYRIRAYRRAARGMQDRKSTRLNSSHANISYAVFCLKKKKTFLFIKIVSSYLMLFRLLGQLIFWFLSISSFECSRSYHSYLVVRHDACSHAVLPLSSC